MRVAMFSFYPWNRDVLPGGVTAVGYYFTSGLARIPDLDLHVICCQPDVERDTVQERDGATIHFLSDRTRLSQLMRMWPQRRKMARVVRRIQPDLVHAQGLGVPAAGALDTNLPCLITIHGIMWKEPVEHPSPITRLGNHLRFRNAYRQMLRTENVILSSGYVSEVLPDDRQYREFVVNNPVGEEIFDIQNRPTSPHVLVVGGLRRRKDPLTSVRVMERVLQTVPGATMHMLGLPSRTPLDQQVADFIAERGLGDRIKLLGLVPNKVLHEEYARASLLLIPSLEETAPVAISEACAVGLPQVGTRAGGIPYMIREGETGFVRPVGDVEGLAERVTAILTDADLRERLARQTRVVGEQGFSLDTCARKTFAAYQEVLAS